MPERNSSIPRKKPQHPLRLVQPKPSGKLQEFYSFRNLPSGYENQGMSASEICGDSLERKGIPRGHMVAVVRDALITSGSLVAVK